MDIVDSGLALVRAILPPADNATPQQVRRYRQNIAIVLGGLITMNITHIAWACGFLTFAGATGFVRADDAGLGTIRAQQQQLALQFKGIQDNQRTAQENQLDGQIQTAREKQCHAIAANNAEAKQFASDKLQEKLGQYYKLTGHSYFRVPDCSEL